MAFNIKTPFVISTHVKKFAGTTNITNKSKAAGLGVNTSASSVLTYNQAGTLRKVVSEDGTQTLTNKTFTDAVINSGMVAGGSALSVTAATHGGKTIALDTAAGTTITLPAATGSGVIFRFVVTVAATSNQHRLSVTGNDTFFGQIISGNDTDNSVVAFPAAAGNNQVNWNGTSTGGTKGAFLTVQDMLLDCWHIFGITDASGIEVTPFATV